MHRLLLILLIALLPLRSLAGDVMAVHAVQAQAMQAAMPADCPMQHGADGLAASCGDCQLCVAVADLQAQSPQILVGLAHPAPSAAPVAFYSAPSRPGLKPPQR